MTVEKLLSEIEAVLDRPSPSVTSVVELDAVTRFAEAIGDPVVDDDGRVLVPPTFLCSLRYRRPPMPDGAEDKMVILDNGVTLARLPVVGERITTSATFTEARTRGPVVVLKLACRYTDEQGAEVGVITCSWMIDTEGEARPPVPLAPRARAELLASKATAGQQSINGHGGPDPRLAPAWDAVDPRALRPGDELLPLVKAPLTTMQFVKFAGASHDFNPLHYDSHVAARMGFPDVIAPGLLKLALFGEHVTLWSYRWGRLLRLDSRYRGVDLAGAQLTSHGTVESVAASEDRPHLITLRLSLRDENGESGTVGTAVVEVSA